MKKCNLFIFEKDGKYLRYSKSCTHTRTYHSIEWIDDIDYASAFATTPKAIKLDIDLATKLAVVVERKVTVVGLAMAK